MSALAMESRVLLYFEERERQRGAQGADWILQHRVRVSEVVLAPPVRLRVG